MLLINEQKLGTSTSVAYIYWSKFQVKQISVISGAPLELLSDLYKVKNLCKITCQFNMLKLGVVFVVESTLYFSLYLPDRK